MANNTRKKQNTEYSDRAGEAYTDGMNGEQILVDITDEPDAEPEGEYTEDGYCAEEGEYTEDGYCAEEGEYTDEEYYAEDGEYTEDGYCAEDGEYTDEEYYAEDGEYVDGEYYADGEYADGEYTDEEYYAENGEYTDEEYYAEDGGYTDEEYYAEEGGYTDEEYYTGDSGYADGGYTDEEYYAEDGGYSDGEYYAEDEGPGLGKSILAFLLQDRRRMLVCGACAALLLLFLIVGLVYYRLPYRSVRDVVTIEAGETCPDLEAFLSRNVKKAYFVTEIDEDLVYDHVGDHEVVIHLYGRDVTSVLRVEDTTPPKLTARDKTIMLGDPFELADFIESMSDVTDCEVMYKTEPEIAGGGVYTVLLEARDEGGNVTEAEARLEVLEDVTPPVIEGVAEITVNVGDSVSYKKDITVTDDYDASVKLEIDNSKVDVDTPGDYPVIYSATDQAGNTTRIETVLHVKVRVTTIQVEPGGVPVTEAAVNEEADKLLASITTPEMTQYEVIQAIYDWCHNKIAYANGTPKTSWVEGAYCGIVQRRGDCYAYAMASKCLLTRAGIVNMDIERIRVGNGMHFWNLVDIGEGWHHFDTCRRGDGSDFFYLTDAELMAYSDTHRAPDYPDGSHNYDRTLYPIIP